MKHRLVERQILLSIMWSTRAKLHVQNPNIYRKYKLVLHKTFVEIEALDAESVKIFTNICS